MLAIVALHSSEKVRAFLAPREQSWGSVFGRRALMLFATGFVIEVTLMPIVLFHFNRAGLYGAFANVVAIPLVTFISMPLIAVALLLDLLGIGSPVWWLARMSLHLLLGLAHFVSSLPGAVKMLPQMSVLTLMAIVAGGLWLALWRGRERWFGLVPMMLGALTLAATPVPDMLISRDGRHVGIVTEDGNLVTLRGHPQFLCARKFARKRGVHWRSHSDCRMGGRTMQCRFLFGNTLSRRAGVARVNCKEQQPDRREGIVRGMRTGRYCRCSKASANILPTALAESRPALPQPKRRTGRGTCPTDQSKASRIGKASMVGGEQAITGRPTGYKAGG